MTSPERLRENLTALKLQIANDEKKYDRSPNSVQLLAASKGQSVEKIMALYEAGVRRFGENYLQEALKKMGILKEKAIEWHYIGPIQSNKTRKIAEHFAWVQSVADEKVALRLNEQRPITLPPLNICIEINMNAEQTKSGITPDTLLEFSAFCASLPHLKLRGLMAIPARSNNITETRETFRKLHSLWQTMRDKYASVDTLSMGMSDDFEAAIAEGSTLIRIGTALFGPREKI